jgi:hypothetical protein
MARSRAGLADRSIAREARFPPASTAQIATPSNAPVPGPAPLALASAPKTSIQDLRKNYYGALAKKSPTRSDPAMATLIDDTLPMQKYLEPEELERRIESFNRGQRLRQTAKQAREQEEIDKQEAREQARMQSWEQKEIEKRAQKQARKDQIQAIKDLEKFNQERKRGDIIASIDYVPPPKFYPKSKKTTPIKNITRIGNPTLEESSIGKIPIDVITADQLKYILENKGLPVLRGNDVESKYRNYVRALSAGLIPDLPALIPKSEILAMSVPELQRYLSDRGMTGRRGGDPLK